ncbi:MAG: ABC transporter permease [Lachnospiraceae bacterium]|nr:ABC transporter permease [Lachnospiraceae bacterium]MBR0152971.1 ABC transporter permease [Lachnospiraceae bacterium]
MKEKVNAPLNLDEQILLHEKRMQQSVKRAEMFQKIGKVWSVGILVLIVVIFSMFQARIFSVAYWQSTLAYMTEIIILGIGEGLIMMAGCIDLGIGTLSALVGVSAAQFIRIYSASLGVGTTVLIATIGGFAIGLIFGWTNGMLVTKLKLSPFLATIGTMSVSKGLALVLSEGAEVVGLPQVLKQVANHRFFGFATPNMLIGWLVVLIVALVLHKTRFGQYTYAVGSNREALQRSGVSADRQIIKLYMIEGFLGALSGLLLVFRYCSANPNTGQTTQLTAIAAAAIGGVSNRGGTGRAEGVLVGALIISVLMTGLVLINVPSYWQQVAVGIMIIMSVYMDQFSTRSQLK